MLLTRRDRGMVAVAVILDVAFHSSSDIVVSASELAERTGILRRTIEPVVQALSRAGLLDSIRGPHGGYRLGRPARMINISEVIALGLNSLEDAGAGLTGRLQRAVVEPLWSDLDEALEAQLRGVTVETLLQRAARAGLRKPVTEPLNFAI